MNAWIEILSLSVTNRFFKVAFYMNAWIEMFSNDESQAIDLVAFYMNAWIEISAAFTKSSLNVSHSI